MIMLLGWLLFLPPWLLLVFLKPKRKRRFLSATFLVIALCALCYEISAQLGWWEQRERAFYFTNMNSLVFGLLPVAALMMFYLTYPNPWLYFGGNLALDTVQCYLIVPYILEKVGLFEMKTLSHTGLYLLQTLVAALIYFYQKWYEHGMSYDTESPPLEEWLRRWSFRQRAR